MAEAIPLDFWQIGDWKVDPSDDTISRNGEATKLEPRTMRLLVCLAEAQGAVVGLDKLLNDVWAGVVVGPASVYQSVSQLRKLLQDTDSPPTYIETVARKGYRLVAPARRVARRWQPPPAATPHASGATEVPVVSSPRRGRLRWVAASVALAAVVAVWVPVRKFLAPTPAAPSLVVLPFVDMSTAKADQPFCDGLTDELSSWLAQLPTLRVVARTSAFAFKDKPTDVREIGRQLGTDYVLEGSMRRTGDNMRITVQLIDAHSGFHQWAGSYDAPLTDIIKVQEDIARSIATNLEIRLTTLTAEGFAARGSSSLQAYQLYLTAHYHYELATRADNERAIELFRQAIAADGDFAPAYIGLARAYLNQESLGNRPIKDIAADAGPLLGRAEKLHSTLADLYVARGELEMRLMRESDALRDLQHAVALNPNSRDAYSNLGLLYLYTGQPRAALQAYSSAALLDPLDDFLHAQRCMAYQDLAEFTAAADECATARALAPASPWPYTAASWLADAQGHVEEALRWNATALTYSADNTDLYAERGKWQLAAGRPAQARDTYLQATRAVAGDARDLDSLAELACLTALGAGGISALKSELARMDVNAASTRTLLDLAHAQLTLSDIPAARKLVDRALAQADYDVEITRSAAWEAREGFSYPLIAAYAYMKSGDSAAAMALLQLVSALLDRMSAAGIERHGIHEIRAQVAALRGDPEGAMQQLT